ncbi:hypothetical protein BG015_008511 [Linnemannia schmuckeri]|uniref:DM2 domain-containing protein n=1 Tax=Linnemannia schmuckeri TaxID=64567 RepID=A0A9P5VFL4_9FUNG|nr:hypothetical protein BG015_008511 [Linnemannia schmuckeri]
MANVQQYRRQITDLIRQADITTVSARSIRKKVEALERTDLAPVKEQFDDLVMEIYEQITDENERLVLSGGPTTQQHNGVEQQHAQIQSIYMPAVPQQAPAPPVQNAFGGFALPPTSYVAPKPATPPVKRSPSGKQPVTPESSRESDDESDASYSSVEGSSKKRPPKKESSKKSSSSSAAKKRKEADKKKDTKKRSSSSKDKDKDDDEPKKKRAKPLNEDGTEKVNGFTRPYAISDTLYNIIGKYGETGPSGRIEMPRHQVVKFLWAYIKENNLQDEKDKRDINCDDKMKALFGLDKINCFSMNKYIGAHLIKPEDVVQPHAA